MRLIDADVFKTEYENLITWVSHRAEKARLREFIKDIQNQPTVEAITVEWIEKKLKCCDNINAEIFVKSLIRDWRKENGRS